MKYKELGKIAYSNEITYIGQYLSLSEFNYITVKKYMDTFIKDKNKCFEDFKNDFFYHLQESQETAVNLNLELPRNYIRPVYKLKIFFTVDISWSFDLYYDLRQPEAAPVDIYIKEVVNVGEIG